MYSIHLSLRVMLTNIVCLNNHTDALFLLLNQFFKKSEN